MRGWRLLVRIATVAFRSPSPATRPSNPAAASRPIRQVTPQVPVMLLAAITPVFRMRAAEAGMAAAAEIQSPISPTVAVPIRTERPHLTMLAVAAEITCLFHPAGEAAE